MLKNTFFFVLFFCLRISPSKVRRFSPPKKPLHTCRQLLPLVQWFEIQQELIEKAKDWGKIKK